MPARSVPLERLLISCDLDEVYVLAAALMALKSLCGKTSPQQLVEDRAFVCRTMCGTSRLGYAARTAKADRLTDTVSEWLKHLENADPDAERMADEGE